MHEAWQADRRSETWWVERGKKIARGREEGGAGDWAGDDKVVISEGSVEKGMEWVEARTRRGDIEGLGLDIS
jgi:hypothetical protein